MQNLQDNNQNQDNNIENAKVRELKKFNQSIQITIEVDQIAKMLLSKMGADATHKELIVETVIGSMMHSPKGLTPLYNSLNGWENELDFQEGQEVMVKYRDLCCPWAHEAYRIDKYDMLVKCKIGSIDVFRGREIELEYIYLNEEGKEKKGTTMVIKSDIQASYSHELEQEHLDFIGTHIANEF